MPDRKTLDNLLRPHVPPGFPGFIIYSELLSTRLHYVCRFIFNQVLQLNFTLTNDLEELERSNLFKINYSNKEIKEVFKILPANLLFEKNVSQQKPKPELENELIYFYKNNGGHLAYDIFASVFYLIARYEEWQNFKPDAHQRFEAENSILFQHGVHLKPVVDHWIIEFRTALEKFYPALKFPEGKMQVMSTIDVDNLYAYKNKGFLRTAGAMAKDVLRGDLKNLGERLAVVSGKKQDPFDIYEDVSAFCSAKEIPLIYFFLYRSGTKYDRTVSPSSGAFKTVFESIKQKGAFMGLHPSYDSAYDEKLFKKELSQIRSGSNEDVTISRQHFLRFDICSTPNLLLKNGISTDFTMGFASSPGFRAGTSFPFNYYDLNEEKETELLFVPFCVMDGAYTVYQQSKPEEALAAMLKLGEEVNKVNGFFISVFHERTFSDHLYKGFGPLYKILHEKLKQL